MRQTGSEFVEVMKKLVKSRGLFMKHDFSQLFPTMENDTDIQDDDSRTQLSFKSISLSTDHKKKVEEETK
jgi:hypothetical protein